VRKLITTTFVSLDGVMQAPGGKGEDPSNGFTQEGWSVHYWDDVLTKFMVDATAKPFAMVLGRRTYEIMAAFWPTASAEEGGPTWNNAPKYVASKSLKGALSWQNSRLLEGDAAGALAKLKQEDGPELQIHGSSALIQSLLPHDVIDEFRVWIHPVVLGKGKRLFGDGAPPRGLTLADSVRSTTGVLINTYRPAGAIKLGTFGKE
jgi:dihydrofolate reductase